ncbi:MAG: acetoacetate--CoA ligase [Bacteroidota bacterium]
MPLWTPPASFLDRAHLTHYRAWLANRPGLGVPDAALQPDAEGYEALWRWSVADVDRFWQSLWRYFDIVAHTPATRIRSGGPEDGGVGPDTRWFEGATLNYAEHSFRHQTGDHPALMFQSERGAAAGSAPVEVAWDNLAAAVAAFQGFLRSEGIGPGDRVAAYLPNVPQAVVAFLATASLGAVWSCCSPDFGVRTVIDRFAQIEPALLIVTDGYTYGGTPYDRTAEVAELRAALPSVRQTVVLPYLDLDAPTPPDAVRWGDALAAHRTDAPPTFEPVPFDHPLWVLYSSGTTGKPKAITHSHGGALLEHLKYLAFHNDTHPGERFFWFTTTGWMMWNFLQASLLVGGVPVLYDGSPGHPDLGALWRLAGTLPIHHFGTSAPYLTACVKQDLRPSDLADLSALRSLGSTGAPLPAEAFDWVYDAVSPDVWLCSMSGGTDVCTAFVGGCPGKPVHRGRIQGRALGVALASWGDDGEPVTEGLGEMVIEKPMPSMPVFFWGDADDERYRAAYFETYPGVWRHGDFIELFDDGSLVIHGRSDATLNRRGVRIGTAELYAVLDGLDVLRDSLVLNLERPDGTDVMPLFVVMAEGEALTDDRIAEIKATLRAECSPRHVPDAVIAVPDVPYTLSGKKMEVPVKKLLLGLDTGAALNKDATRNPAAVEHFAAMAEAFWAEYLLKPDLSS